MRKLNLLPLVCMLFAVCSFSKADTSFMELPYRPVYMTRDGLEKSVRYIEGQHDMADPGKIYVRGSTIFVNEKYKGVHIIDNSNPKTPKLTGFIVAPGCIDIAVKGNIIYIDNAVDFVAFDLDEKQETARFKNYFPEHSTAPDGMVYGNIYDRPDGYILVGWKKNGKYPL